MQEEGLLTSVKGMRLENINIRGEEISQLTLPTFDDKVVLWGLSGDISQFLTLISCHHLRIYSTKLSRSDTKSLVKCLYNSVSQIVLWNTTLDFSVLSQYDGTGKCDYLKCYNVRYFGQVTQWAHKMRWKVEDDTNEIKITRY